jgi:hypothetical protein
MNTAACLNSMDFDWFDATEAATQQRQSGEMDGLPSVAEWIEQIQTLWTNGAESRLELASLISTIRNHLRQRRGAWSSLWESGEIPFSKRKAEKLVVVGDGLGWAVNANACSHLPTEWNALYYIAKLGRSLQERLIQKREIRPTLTVGQARDLFIRFRGKPLKNNPRKARFRERLRRFEDFFVAELPNCSQAEMDLARASLTGLVELIPVPNANPSFPVSVTPISLLEPVLKMGGAGDSPAPIGDPPTGTAASNVAKRPCPFARTVAPRLRPTSRRTAQAGRLCYQQTIFQTRS